MLQRYAEPAVGSGTNAPESTSLSVLVPVYNEQYLVETSLRRLLVLAESALLTRVQIIVVDDCSRDQTPQVLQSFQQHLPDDRTGKVRWLFLRHERNQGKGAAIRTALEHAECELTVIHDADLEYHPRDLLQMVPLFLTEDADAVFGSRFMAGGFKRALFFRHSIGNHILTFLCDLASDLNLTDIETCYKMVRTELLRSIPLVSGDFRIEPEVAIKLAKRGARVFEVPISYSGRTYQEGKKINWTDGVKALLAILQFRLSDNICKRDQYGSEVVPRLSRAPKYTRWQADLLRPHVGERVLELGAGIGTLTLNLVPRKAYWACDANPLWVRELQKLSHTRPYLHGACVDPANPATFPAGVKFDTVILQNVAEHVEDDVAAFRTARSVLDDNGRVLILVPNAPGLYGSLDKIIGHQRRYTRRQLTDAAAQAGLELVKFVPLNRIGAPVWWMNSRILHRQRFGLLQIKVLNALVPLLRHVDRFLPFPPMTLVGVFANAAKVPADTRSTTESQAAAHV
ncbi:MAG TPA: bifunctional glycosyltransferase/class I SAM-dependent methyltransferase [Terriglobales bacterium]